MEVLELGIPNVDGVILPGCYKKDLDMINLKEAEGINLFRVGLIYYSDI